MEGMKDSGFKWLNNIPDSWGTKPIHAVASVNKISFDPRTKPDTTYCEFSMPAFDAGCKPLLVKGDAMESTRIILSKPVILMNKLNVRKQRVWNVKKVPGDALCTSEFVPLEVKEGVSQDYVYWCLLNKSAADNLDSLSNGSSNSQIRVRPYDINHFQIALPPTLDEQQSIADYLSDKCSKLECEARMIEKQLEYLSRYRASVIHEAVTRGIDSSVPTKPSGIDWIDTVPQSWSITKIKHVSKICNGLDYSSEDVCDPSEDGAILVVRSSNIKNGKMAHADDVYVNLQIPEACRLRKGDLVIVRANGSAELVGKSALFDFEEECAAGGFMLICRSYAGHYLKWLLQSDLLGFYRNRFTTTTIGRISSTLLGNMAVPWPQETERKAIADYLDARTAAIDAILDTKRKQLDILKRRRQSLIYEYVTGKRRVTKEA